MPAVETSKKAELSALQLVWEQTLKTTGLLEEELYSLGGFLIVGFYP